MSRIRLSLGRTSPLPQAPPPPAIAEPVVRLVHTDFGLAELFIHTAGENQMDVEPVRVEELPSQLIQFLRAHNCRRLAISGSEFLDRLGFAQDIRNAGFDLRPWNELTPNELHGFDAAITDVYAAIAETGSLVIRPGPGQGTSLSLVPPIHIAILEPRNLVSDLVDLFEKLGKDGQGSGTVIINGPSKAIADGTNAAASTRDPQILRIFILQ